MGLFEGIKSQLRSVIEWNGSPDDALIWKWDGSGEELKNASKLIVKPGQAAIFLYEGSVKAVHLQSGLFELSTANIPFWTTISKFMQAFQSEHKAEIYYVRLTELLDQKWGTKGPVKYIDPKYGFPVGLRAFGNFSFRITEPENFFVNVSSARKAFSIDAIRVVIVDRILTPLTDLLAESGFSYVEVDKNRNELSDALKTQLDSVFVKLGFSLTDFRIENTDFDEDTQARIREIANTQAKAQAMNALGSVDATAMRNYATLQQLDALKTAAGNESGGLAGLGVGAGAGWALGQNMMGGMAGMQQQAAQMPPPLPQSSYFVGENGNRIGPFDMSTMATKAADGSIKPESLVWKQGMASWIAAGSVDELKGMFPPALPPL